MLGHLQEVIKRGKNLHLIGNASSSLATCSLLP